MKNLYECVYEWMVSYKRNSVKPATYDRLLTSLKLMSRYPISEVLIDEMTTGDIQEYVNQLVVDDYALTTIKKQVHLIGSFMDYANMTGLAMRPVHKGVRLPSESAVKKHKKQVIAYTRSEQAALREVLSKGDSPAYYAAILMMETGMRIGEVLALGWDDVDWQRRAIRIRKTIVHIADTRRSHVQNSAKSFSSNRTIPMSSGAYDVLSKLSEDMDDGGFVLHDAYGHYLTYEAVRWWVRKACDEAGVPYYGQHVFRHTFATNCYERGCDVKLLSRLLGHSDVMITYNVYIHLFGDALEEMRAVIG